MSGWRPGKEGPLKASRFLARGSSKNPLRSKFLEHLLDTPVNKPVHTFAAHSSQLVATKIIRLGDALAAYSCYLFRARERKDKIVLGQSPSPEKAHYGCRF